MGVRALWQRLQEVAQPAVIRREVDPHLEMARVIHRLEGRPIWFDSARGSEYPVAAGLCSHRDYMAAGLGVAREGLISALAEALAHPQPPPVVAEAPCQEVVEREVDLRALPILTHLAEDGGPYITSGVAIIQDPQYGRNMSIHRLLRLDERRLAARLVEGRGTETAWSRGGDIPMAVCIGNDMPVLVAAAMSPAKGVDELAIAQALAPTPLVKCRTLDLYVPAEAEFVLEGRLTHQLVAEGPFLDLTEKPDIVRQQPVFVVECLTHRRDAVYQALLAGGQEHKLLMGVPREPTIFAEVNQVCRCLNVLITPGGASWLHAVVQIAKRAPDDGPRAIQAAFRGHSSLKHVVVVDEDIDLYDPHSVEWAIATRFQADRDLVLLREQPSSSLDPSALHVPGQKSRTAKLGVDATIPWTAADGRAHTPAEIEGFYRVGYGGVDLAEYLDEGEGGSCA
ncbi:MAG: UbiD family decarboxylase [Chloroflexi bacterium]|nr:UbiD family decarboxylase [Chloroflexota bacterium]